MISPHDSDMLCSIMEEMIAIMQKGLSSSIAITTELEHDSMLRDIAAVERTIAIVRDGLFEQAVNDIIRKHRCST